MRWQRTSRSFEGMAIATVISFACDGCQTSIGRSV
jgi:predicted  nucleic acid-binding Zn-ribbon protein